MLTKESTVIARLLHWIKNLTRSDKIGLIAGKCMFLLNNVYLYFCVSHNNSVSFSKISINFYISNEKVNYSCQLHTEL